MLEDWAGSTVGVPKSLANGVDGERLGRIVGSLRESAPHTPDLCMRAAKHRIYDGSILNIKFLQKVTICLATFSLTFGRRHRAICKKTTWHILILLSASKEDDQDSGGFIEKRPAWIHHYHVASRVLRLFSFVARLFERQCR
jgi:hypothetical protein